MLIRKNAALHVLFVREMLQKLHNDIVGKERLLMGGQLREMVLDVSCGDVIKLAGSDHVRQTEPEFVQRHL